MSMIVDPAKLKVVELRAELSARGLDTKGNKPVLVKRLREAFEKESGDVIEETSILDTSTEEKDTPDVSISQPSPSPSPQPMKESTPERENLKLELESESEPSPKSDGNLAPESIPASESNLVPDLNLKSEPEPLEIENEKQIKSEIETTDTPMDEEVISVKVEKDEEVIEENDSASVPEKEPRSRKSRWGNIEDSSEVKETEDVVMKSPTPEESRGEKRRHSSPSPNRTAATRKRSRSPVKEDEPVMNDEQVLLSWIDSDLNLQLDKNCFTSGEPLHYDGFGFMWAGVRSTHGAQSGKVWFEVKLLENCEWKDKPKMFNKEKPKEVDKERIKEVDKEIPKAVDKETPKEVTEETSKEVAEETSKEVTEETSKEVDKEKLEEADKETPKEVDKEKPEEVDKEKPEEVDKEKPEEVDKEKPEEVDKEQPEEVNMEISEEVNKKQSEEVDKEQPEEVNKEQSKEEEEDTLIDPIHVFRIGWSLQNTSLQLGEEPFSYGYDSQGFSVTDSTFNAYGKTYTVGDVVATFLDLESDPVTITYTVNGELQSNAFTIPRSELPDVTALYAHILTRNIKFEVNFGQNDTPWFPQPNGFETFEFLNKIESERKLVGVIRPEKREDCEVIMMVGLPCSGKTKWVTEFVAKNPEKRFNMLGISAILDKMKVQGKPRKENLHILLEKCSRCLSKLTDFASLRRRNFILDQTNLFSSAQRRKMRAFDGYRRHAVVIVANDDEQKEREKLRQQADGKALPDSALLEMKANMSLPTVCDWLEEVTYEELDESKSKEMVQKYNKQGRDSGYGPNYNYRSQSNYQSRSYNDRRSSQSNRNSYSNRDNRNNRWSGGGGGGGGQNRSNNWGNNNRNSGGWGRQDRNNRGGGGGGGGYNRNNRNSGGGGGGGGQNRNQGSGYNRNRNQPRNQNKGGNWNGSGGGGGGGNWGNQGNWNNQGNWGGGQSGGWPQAANWNQYDNNGGGGGNQWRGGYGNPQSYQQGYGSGYGNQQQQQQYSNWNYYGQYAQGWNPQGDNSAYNQYAQQWAQYAGYGGNYGSTGGGGGNNTSTTANSNFGTGGGNMKKEIKMKEESIFKKEELDS